MIVADLDDRAAGFLIIAIEDLRRRMTYTGVSMPPGVAELAAALRQRLSQGQAGPALDSLAAAADAVRVSPLAITYDEAAALLGVGRSSVKRLVASGRIATVSIGGAVRIRAADLEAYVAELAPIDRTAGDAA